MTTTTILNQAVPTTPKRRTFRWWMGAALLLCAWLMVGGVIAQVFFAGSAILVDGSYWLWHLAFAQWLTYLSLAMGVVALLGRLPRGLLLRALLVVLLLVLQYLLIWAFAKIGLGSLRGLHAVNALALFALNLDLARRGWHGLAK